MEKVLWGIGVLVAIGCAAMWTIRRFLTPGSVMRAYARDAVDTARTNFQAELDYSEGSIRQLEEILDKQYKARQGDQQISEKDVELFCKMWGAYLGEVLRRSYSGEWSIPQDGVFQGNYVLTVGSTLTSPPAKVWKRLTDGDGDNVYMYYRVLVSKFSAEQSGPSREH